MNLTRQPIYAKPEKVGPKARKPLPRRKPIKAKPKPRDPYLDGVRSLPCCICVAFGEVQQSPTTAHHPFHDRYGNEKVPDHEAIPLCDGHHQGDRDTSKLAIHRGKETWRAKYGSDRDYIAATQDKLAHLLA